MAEIRHLENRHDVIFLCRGWSDLDKIWQTGTEWHVDCGDVSKWKPDVEFQYGGRLGEFNGMSSQSHVYNYHIAGCCATWWIHCHDSRATCHIAECKNFIRHIENRFLPYFIFYLYFIYFFVFNAVYALTSGGFRIVSDTLVWRVSVLITIFIWTGICHFFLCILWKPSRTIERRVVCDTLGDITSSVVQNVDHTTSECNDPKQATGELFEWKASNERDTSRTHVDHRWLSRPKAFVRRHDWPEVTASEKLLQFIQRNFLERLGA